jgi:hypothetical protein
MKNSVVSGMKKIVALLSLMLLLALPSLVVGQNSLSKAHVIGQPNQPNQQSFGLTSDVETEILTLAAPQFGFDVEDFIRMYYTCGCITITEIGPGTYFVEYGGIGIQIVIDGCRLNSSTGNAQGSRKR